MFAKEKWRRNIKFADYRPEKREKGEGEINKELATEKMKQQLQTRKVKMGKPK